MQFQYMQIYLYVFIYSLIYLLFVTTSKEFFKAVRILLKITKV